jgi:hypothetical protein
MRTTRSRTKVRNIISVNSSRLGARSLLVSTTPATEARF